MQVKAQAVQLPADQMAMQPAAHRLAAPKGKALDRARERQPAAVTPETNVIGRINAAQLKVLLQEAQDTPAEFDLAKRADQLGVAPEALLAVLEHCKLPAAPQDKPISARR